MRLFIQTLAALLIAGTAVAQDETWSSDVTKEHPAASAENRIIRWCSEDGSKTRFASANIDLKGFKPCGELNIPISCDASGKRLISKGPDTPYAYKDCGVGPRIQIRSSGAENEPVSVDADGESFSRGLPAGGSVDPLSRREKSDLTRDIKGVEMEQAKDFDMQMQKVLDSVMNTMLAQTSVSQARNSGVRVPINDKDVEMLIRYVDPQNQNKLRQILKQTQGR